MDVTTVKPLDGHYLDNIGDDTGVITLEENVLSGGFGQSVTAYLADKTAITVKNMGVADVFVAHATVDEQIRANGLDVESVKAAVNDRGKLFEGMNVRVSIHRSLEKQLVVPKGAVVLRSGKQVVFRFGQYEDKGQLGLCAYGFGKCRQLHDCRRAERR